MKEAYLWEFGCTKIKQNENPIVRNVHILMHHIIKKNILGLKEICQKFELLAFNFLLQPMQKIPFNIQTYFICKRYEGSDRHI